MLPRSLKRVVLDTSFFVNPVIGEKLYSTSDAVKMFLEAASNLNLEFYMPVSTAKELLKYIDESKLTLLRAIVLFKSPSRFELTVPARLFYEYIEEMRARINKGLRVAEEVARSIEPEEIKIRKLREKYREALREGIIDSIEDLDVLLLAKELGGVVVSNDKGVIKWAEKLGVGVIESSIFWQLILKNLWAERA